MKGESCLHSDWEITVIQIFISSIENMLQMFLSRWRGETIGHGAKLSIEPASAGSHKRILTLELSENIGLKEWLHTSLKL